MASPSSKTAPKSEPGHSDAQKSGPARKRRIPTSLSILLILWVISLGLGYFGFHKHALLNGEPRTTLDNLYLTMQLISMNSGAVSGVITWELQVARFVLPVLTAYTALQTLALLFQDQIKIFRLRFARGHVIICGLGSKGYMLANSFQANGERVVLIESDEKNEMIQICRAKNLTVLMGDARKEDVLRRAGARDAKLLVSLISDDAVNAEIALRAEQLALERSAGKLTCVVNIADPQLLMLLRNKELATRPDPRFRLEFFNIYDYGARILLNQYPFLNKPHADPADATHVVIVGASALAESLVVNAAKRYWGWRATPAARLRVSLIDALASESVERIKLRYPLLASVCELQALPLDISSEGFQRASFLYNQHGEFDAQAIYICAQDDSAGLQAALRMMPHAAGRKAPLVIQMAADSGLAVLLHNEHKNTGRYHNVHAFGLLTEICSVQLLQGGTHEILARALHQEYLNFFAEQSSPPDAGSTRVAWDELSEEVKESNRNQADHIGVKLQATNYRLSPLTDWQAADLQFTEDEVNVMARMEHARWKAEHEAKGWRYAPGERDAKQKTHPLLVAWEDLDEFNQEKNRQFIRKLPQFLVSVGLQIDRVELHN